jgi:type I restriction enzyme R subunit
MVVTSSRLHAVRYKQAIDAYLEKHGDANLAALVAFSGKVVDEQKASYTEASMNRLPEAETAKRFAAGNHQMLIVAEKFQTGFDQPLLHTMYVDKVLTGLAAVQTLSRLNRIHPPDLPITFKRPAANEVQGLVVLSLKRRAAPPARPQP